ncbi:guanine nucleotide exchange factor, putative [Entamoeba dispar SAW760]|uniref:Guanine nucleotide exchange factor, putative n=1 Tax=Entamoeba dispar (strain ATCC PRA-260 / SAW760) TaxID=370354 RepID=B0EAD2_ENTDS|nr:guanine nucleotide exchange factor, putative [Entamoeba dispar SAW760]EDR28517.1 guanine nucleotide exchange factor, putative [Entamoeba dispar SAW760]|eukprot:EDR28517.1 guanine nucleotide exchange factor, putative [Entamoeba dispar SAW760]
MSIPIKKKNRGDATPQLNTPQSGLGYCVDFDNISTQSGEDVQVEFQDTATVVITETVNEKTEKFKRTSIPRTSFSSRGSVDDFQTKFYGECPFFPTPIPERIQHVVISSGNIFMIGEDGVYATGLINYKEKKVTENPIVIKGIPAGIKQITGNHKKMIILIDGKVYTTSNLEDIVMLKRVGELQGVSQIACSEEHYAALTTVGDVYLWGTNTYGEIGKNRIVSMNRPARVVELGRKKIIKVVCREGYTACLTEEGDVITLGEMIWQNMDKVVDIVGLRENLWGLKIDGSIISNDGRSVIGNNRIDRITEGLGSIVGESNGKLYVLKNNEWEMVDIIGARDWSGYSTSLCVLENGKKIGFTDIFNEFKKYIKQMTIIKRNYIDILLPKIRDIKMQLSTKDDKKDKKRLKKQMRTLSVEQIQSNESTSHLVKLEEPLEYLYLLYNKSIEVFSFLMKLYGNNISFKISDLYQKFFEDLEVLFIDYSEAFPKYVEVINISKMLCQSFLTEIEQIEKNNFTEDECCLLFNKHCDLLSVAIIPFKFLSKFYELSLQYRKINKEFSRSYFEKFETLLFRCNEILKFEDIHSIEYVYSTSQQEFVVYLSTMKDLVLQLTRPNIREPKYREIFLLMYRLYTSPECVINYLIPHISIDETGDRKTQILIVLKQWMQSYPNDFSLLGKSEKKLINYLSTSKEPFSKIRKEKLIVLDLFNQIKGNSNITIYPPLIFDNSDLDPSDFMGDPYKITNSMTYVYKKLFIRIKPVELLYYLDKTKKDQTYNIKNMIDSFNGLSKMYASMFNKISKDQKLSLLQQTIKILDIFLNRDRNYHAICGIVFAFVRIPEIEQLKSQLKPEERKRYDFFDNLCLFENNYKNLRDTISSSQQPLLPFMGTISRDLVLVSEYNASKEKELFNFNKLRIMHKVVMDIINYQPGEPQIPTDIDNIFHKKFCLMHQL